MFKKINEFDDKYSNKFFALSLIVILVFLFYFAISNRTITKECTLPNKLVNETTNYSYEITYIKDNKIINLYVKRYNEKYLIEKVDDNIRSIYYIYYTDILEKASDGKYIKYRSDNILADVDNKFLILDYLNSVSLDSNISNEEDLTCYTNRKLNIHMCINIDDSIGVKMNDYELIYKITGKGNVSDFNVSYDNYIQNIEE